MRSPPASLQLQSTILITNRLISNAMPHELVTSDAYEITTSMLCERIGCTDRAIRNYVARKLIVPGKRRPGVAGLFWTVAQANKLLQRIGSRAKRFSTLEES